MSGSRPELVDIAERVCSWAQEGEQVEVIVGRSRDTDIRVYEGEIEHLQSAESAGIGVRVVRDHRQGFAYAGTLDDDVLAEVLDVAADGVPVAGLGLVAVDRHGVGREVGVGLLAGRADAGGGDDDHLGGAVGVVAALHAADAGIGRLHRPLQLEGEVDLLRRGHVGEAGPEQTELGVLVPVGDGVPTLRVTERTVGGTAA